MPWFPETATCRECGARFECGTSETCDECRSAAAGIVVGSRVIWAEHAYQHHYMRGRRKDIGKVGVVEKMHNDSWPVAVVRFPGRDPTPASVTDLLPAPADRAR